MGVLVILSFTLPVLLVMAFGWFNGVLVTRFSIQPIIATLVLFIAGRGIAQVATNGNLQVFKNPDFQFIAMGRIAGIPAQVIIMIIVAVLAHCLIRYTVIGRQIIAVGGNEKAARLTGIPVRRVKTFVYIVSGALAGIAGLIVVARNSASDANLVGLGMELDADRSRRGRRFASHRRPGQYYRHGAWRLRHPAGALYASCQWRARCGGADRQSRADRHRRVHPAACQGVTDHAQNPHAALHCQILRRFRPSRRAACAGRADPVRRAALRQFHLAVQYSQLPALQFHVRADCASAWPSSSSPGGIDLSVGGVAAMASVVAAYLSPYGWVPGLAGGMAAGLIAGSINGLIITRMRIQPFIATLAMMLAAYGTALLLANNQSVSVSYDTGFTTIGQDDFLGFPIPAWIAALAYVLGWIFLERHPAGRHVLAIGDGEATANLDGIEGRKDAVCGLRAVGAACRSGRRHPRVPVRGGGSRPRAWAGSCLRLLPSWSAARC